MRKFVNIETLRYVGIGRKGENRATTIDIDCTAWTTAHPFGELSLVYRVPGFDTEVEPDITVEGGHILWEITDVETAVEGTFEGMVRLYDDGVLILSRVFNLAVEGGFSPYNPMPQGGVSPITDIRLIGSDGNHDFYAITCSDGSVYEFTVTNGEAPTVVFSPVEGGYRLSVTDKGGTHSIDLRPNFVLAGAIQQEITDSRANVPSSKAVKDALAAKPAGWTDEQVSLLADLFQRITYTAGGGGQAVADSLIESLRNGKSIVSISAEYIGGEKFVGDTISPADFAVTAVYSDGERQRVEGHTIKPTVLSTVSTAVTVSFSGMSVVVSVPAAANDPISMTRFVYTGTTTVGQELDLTAMSYTIRFANGTERDYTDTNLLTFTQDGEEVTTIKQEGENVIRAAYVGYESTVFKDFTVVGTPAGGGATVTWEKRYTSNTNILTDEQYVDEDGQPTTLPGDPKYISFVATNPQSAYAIYSAEFIKVGGEWTVGAYKIGSASYKSNGDYSVTADREKMTINFGTVTAAGVTKNAVLNTSTSGYYTVIVSTEVPNAD